MNPSPDLPDLMGRSLLNELFKWSGDCDEGRAVSLINAGAPLEVRNEHGDTPLILAAMNGHADVVRALINKGAKIDARGDKDGRSALNWSATQGHIEIVLLLLSSGADILEKDHHGKTALDKAREWNRTEIIQLFNLLSEQKNLHAEEKTEAERSSEAERVLKRLKQKAPKKPFGGFRP